MKKLSYLLLAFIAVIGLNSCSHDDDVVFIAQPDPEGINFTNTFSSSYVLTEATLENPAERFVWNTVEVDVPTNITYELQGSTDPDFESFDILGSTTGNNVAVTVDQLMNLAEDAGLDNDPTTEAPNTGQLYFRVVASVGTGGELAHMSEVQALTVILPEATGEEEETFRNLFLVGNATAAGWDPKNNPTPMFRDPANPDIYHFVGKFVAGEFKLVETTAWQPQWGLSDGVLTSSEILGSDPGAFPVDAEGYYTLMINVDEMTYTWEPYDASSAATYETIGFLGSATAGLHETGADGWGSDVDLTQSSFNPHIWYANSVALGDGELKFRAADAWDVNWGADTPLSGMATMNGPNIPVTEGLYNIWFNDLTGRYILIPIPTEE